MRAVGGDEVQFDPTSRLRQPSLDQFRIMVSGIIQKDVDRSYARMLCLARHQRLDRTQGVDRGHIFYDSLIGFKIDGAMNI